MCWDGAEEVVGGCEPNFQNDSFTDQGIQSVFCIFSELMNCRAKAYIGHEVGGGGQTYRMTASQTKVYKAFSVFFLN